MKDEDFDNLGKRLYDLEADPPKDGWEKLRPAIAIAPAGKAGWMRRHAWKSLFVVLPVLFYSVYYISSLEESEPIASISETDVNRKTESVQSLNTEETKPLQPKEVNDNSKNDVVSRSSDYSPVENSRSRNAERNRGGLQDKTKTPVGEKTNSELSSKENVASNFSSGLTETKNDIVNSETSPSDQNATTGSAAARNGNITAPDSAKLIVEEALQDEGSEEEISLTSEQPEEKEDKAVREWRISVAFSPDFQTSPVKPVVNDEVYVTDVYNSTPVKQIGYGFSFGVGRNLSSNFYLDAQLSCTKVSQDIFYTFATGNVDTLIAIQQADNSVLVKPVYEMMDRELRSKHQYGGLRVMATYYFWSKPRSRFNLSTAIGAHYLFASMLEENRSGEWKKISGEPAERMNYSFMIGAGCSIKVVDGWELMINPTLSYFLNEVKMSAVPYSSNKQSLGVNLMVSKTLFKKE